MCMLQVGGVLHYWAGEGCRPRLFTCINFKCDGFIKVTVLEHMCIGIEVFGFVKCVILCLCPQAQVSDLVSWVRGRMMVLRLRQ